MKYFIGLTYTYEELVKEKKHLCMKLHPDKGGNEKEFILMMDEFKKIESILANGGVYDIRGKEEKKEEPKKKEETKRETKEEKTKEKEERKESSQKKKKTTINPSAQIYRKEQKKQTSNATENSFSYETSYKTSEVNRKPPKNHTLDDRDSHGFFYNIYVYAAFSLLTYMAFTSVIGPILLAGFPFIVKRFYKIGFLVAGIAFFFNLPMLFEILSFNPIFASIITTIISAILHTLPFVILPLLVLNVGKLLKD